MNPTEARLAAAVPVAERVVGRLRLSLAEGVDFASAAASGEAGDLDALRALDAFIQRFQQTVEVLTHRLYPAIYRWRQAGERPPPLVTLLAFLEGEGVIADERAWIERVEVRNMLVHEYPLSDEDRHAALDRAQTLSIGIPADLATALSYIARHSPGGS